MRNIEPEATRQAYSFDTAGVSTRRVNWWLRFTSMGLDKPQETLEQREIVRRSRLISWVLLGVLVTLLAFLPAVTRDVPSAFAVGGAFLGTLLALALNRFGFVNLAGSLLVILMCTAIISVVIAAPGGKISLVYLPAYDILALPVVVAATILPRWSGFITAVASAIFIYADLLLQAKASDLQQAIATYGLPVLAGRPISILIMVAVIAYLWVRSMDLAVKRADREGELRALQQEIAEVKTRWSGEANDFVQGVIKAVASLANGQEGQISLPPGHSFSEQATFLNTQLRQFYRIKQKKVSGNNEQIEIAATYLLRILSGLYNGKITLNGLDPNKFSTNVPVIDEIAKYLYVMLQK